MQRSGLGSELDIDCLFATLCLGTMISWLHYVRCVVWLQINENNYWYGKIIWKQKLSAAASHQQRWLPTL